MFLKKETTLPYLSRMLNYMTNAIECSCHYVSCAEEIKPMINAFFKKAISARIVFEHDMIVCQSIEYISEAVAHLASNTRNYEKMSKKEVEIFHQIFEEFDLLFLEALKFDTKFLFESYFSIKLYCILEFLYNNHVGMHDSEKCHENWRDGMLFQDYENLWKVIHLINTDFFDLLYQRGFSTEFVYKFWDSFITNIDHGKEMSEEEKIETFMSLLDGQQVRKE